MKWLFLVSVLACISVVNEVRTAHAAGVTKVVITNGKWRLSGKVTYPGAKAEGLLMNVRMVNSVFEDGNDKTRPKGFDPDANTNMFIKQIPDYVAHGVRAFTLSLQGGMPGYEGAVNSAFKADGSLRESYLKRVRRVIEACDRQGVLVILGCYYQRQDQILKDEDAVRAGVVNAARWIKANGFTNVMLEVANEFAHRGFDHRILQSAAGEAELIELAKKTAPQLLVSTSGMGSGTLPDEVAKASDFLLIHFNTTTLGDIPARIAALKKYGKPIVCNEDDKVGADGEKAVGLCVAGGASWGFMHSQVNQYFPLQFKGANDDPAVYALLKKLTSVHQGGSVSGRSATKEQPQLPHTSLREAKAANAIPDPRHISNGWRIPSEGYAVTRCALVATGEVAAAAKNQRAGARSTQSLRLPRIPGVKPRNVIFILADDHRYDAMGFLQGQAFLSTPRLDAMAQSGVHMRNAFVTTALCSPSRASILTGLYAHQHRVVDNNNPVSPDLVFFPQYLQKAGYETAFIGKWHMGGESDDPQRGFDHWVSFKGQGTYLPGKNGLNVNGKRVPQKGYITDELTDYALDWLDGRKGDKPFMLYLSHKAVHSEFIPAERHKGRYADRQFVEPKTMDPANHKGAPMWVQNQRNSWHGVDFPYHGDLNIAGYYKRYAETLLSVDESIGRVMDGLKKRGLYESTLVIYMGDNGFAFGEHGLIDKRTAYEESMRVPMLAQCPELFKGGAGVNGVVANIDIAPTILEAAGLQAPKAMAGRSFMALAKGEKVKWRETLLYEYYWERNFPQTPTLHALRGNQYKYMHYHGIWDVDELYDLGADPLETDNLIFNQEHQPIVKQMNQQLFDTLTETNGMYIPLYRDRGGQQNLRRKAGSKAAAFPPELMREKDGRK